MINYFLACASNSVGAGGGCYDWPVIKQIIMLFGYVIEYIFKFISWVGIPNIGLTIILLTIVIKCVLLPLTIKQQRFTKLSSYAQPELRAIQAKYQGKRDSYSVQAMQAETKAVYAKYGISQTTGCIQSFIQFPILIALYGAIRNLPLYIEAIRVNFENIISTIGSTDITSVSNTFAKWADFSMDDKIVSLYSLPTSSWKNLFELFSGNELAAIQTNYDNIHMMNSFLGLDLGETPWAMITSGAVLAILLPLLSGLFQWLSIKLAQASGQAADDAMGNSMKTMNLMMPLISVFFCFTLPSAVGLYWTISSLFQVILQVIINKRYHKIDMDEFVKQNMEKAELKAKKKQENSKGKNSSAKGSALSRVANTNTKNIQSQPPATLKDKANINVNSASKKTSDPPPANSLAAKAGLVKKYNEEQGINTNNESGSSRKKYKK